MKNAMKKLMAFALVAVMLVGALPFGASAANEPITFVVVGSTYGEEGERFEHAPDNAEGNSIQQLLKHFGIDLENNEFVQARIWTEPGQYTDTTDASTMCAAGTSVRVRVAGVDPDPEVKPDEDEGTGEDEGTAEGSGENEGSNENEGAEKEETVDYIVVKVNIGSSTNTVYQQNVYPAKDSEATVENLLKYYFARQSEYGENWEKTYYFSHAWSSANQENVDLSDSIKVGDTVSIRLMPIETENDDKDDDKDDEKIGLIVKVEGDGVVKQTKEIKKDGVSVNYLLKNYWYSTWADDYDFVSYKLDDGTKGSSVADNIYAGEIVTVYLKEEVKTSKLNSNKVYLHVFMNNDFDDPAKNINITNGIAADGKLDLYSDVKSVIKEYFSAKDSDGIKYDGMYISTGNWAGDFLTDTKDETITNVDELKEEGYVHLNVMITNAKLKSSSSADSSNPKTGDNIMMAVSVMTLSASALAVFFYLNKKRAVK